MLRTPLRKARQAATKNGHDGQRTAPLASTNSQWSSSRPNGTGGVGSGKPIGAQRNKSALKNRQTRKRLRMSRTIPAMSIPTPWPMSCAISSMAPGWAACFA